MGKHFNSKHDDATWRGLFGRWHAKEAAAALRAEAGVSGDTWSANAKRLGMRLKDLPEGHPARLRAPAFADRADDYKHPNSLLDEGQWRALFRLRARGVPDTVLSIRFGVHAATICSQAEARGIRRADIRAAVEAALGEGDGAEAAAPPPPAAVPLPIGDGEETAPAAPATGDRLEGVDIDVTDAARTRASFDAAIRERGARADYAGVTLCCRAKTAVERAVFAAAGSPHPLACGEDPPPEGEGEAPAPAIELRDAQRPPEGAWSTWLFLGGRGAGKTLAGAMWLSDMAEALGPRGRLALIGPTLHDVREVMIEGVSGIAGLPRWKGGARPVFEPSRRRLTFPNGAVAYAFSAEDPDSLRGPQFGAAWADELCAWRNASDTLALLRMGLRLAGPASGGANARPAGARCLSAEAPPRLFISTTPRPIAALRTLRAEPGLVQTHAATRDNADHLAAGFLAGLERLYGGTRKAAQELEGRVVEAEGALFTAEMLARARGGPPLSPSSRGAAQRGTRDPGGRAGPADAAVTRGAAVLGSGFARRAPRNDEGVYDRVVVAIDPTTTASGNACGIVAAGRCGETVHVLADRSIAGLGPDGWARRAVRTAQEFGAAAIVAEVNQGGEMVQAVLRTAGCSIPVRAVRATKGKRVRAEPVAALYEQGRVTHAPGLGALEEELMAFGGEDEGACDLDRADALVWAVTDLLIDRAGTRAGPRISFLDPPRMSWGIAGRGR